MLFHKKGKRIPNIELKINDQFLERVDSFVFLGLILDQEMSWKIHSQKVHTKISKVGGILARLKRFLPSNILLTIYNSLLLPRINYCLLCWGFINTKGILLIQKKSVRLITGSGYFAHSDPLFQNLNLMKIDDINKRLKVVEQLTNKTD